MSGTVCYIKLNRTVESGNEDIFIKDLGSVHCASPSVEARVKAIKVHKFQQGKKNKKENRCVISVLRIIELIEQNCDGVSVESLGEKETILEYRKERKDRGVLETLKIILVAVISFFGTAFTIMAYHNDISITKLFSQIYVLVMGEEPQGVTFLEGGYSLGLAIGIILFFNHVGGKKLTKDPTPIEVEMKKYEKNVNDTLAELAEREEKTIDVD